MNVVSKQCKGINKGTSLPIFMGLRPITKRRSVIRFITRPTIRCVDCELPIGDDRQPITGKTAQTIERVRGMMKLEIDDMCEPCQYNNQMEADTHAYISQLRWEEYYMGV